MSLYRVSRLVNRQLLPPWCRSFTATSFDGQVRPRGPYYEQVDRGSQARAEAEKAASKATASSSTPSSTLASSPSPTESTTPVSTPSPAPAPSHNTLPSSPTPAPTPSALVSQPPPSSTHFVPTRATPQPSPSPKGTYKNGVLIPPKPEEPENCCMSGCVNCVWDIYQEEIDARKAALQLAEQKGQELLAQEPCLVDPDTKPETPEDVEQKLEKETLADVPAGIQAFMAMEKKMREKKSGQ